VTPLSRRDALLLILLPMVFTGRALVTGGVYAPVDLPYLTEPLREMRGPLGVPRPHNGILSDLYAQMIPWRKAVQFSYAHGRWPLWNPFILSGTVLAAAAQPAAYSPFTLLACLLPVPAGLTFSAAIAFFLAGLGAYLFARELGCRELVALIAAAGWMYSMPMAFFVLWAIGGAWAFLPLVLLGTHRCVRAPGLRSAALLTVALTLLVLAGRRETALRVVAVGAAYGLVLLPPPRAVAAAFAAAALALFGLLARAGWMPLAAAMQKLPLFDVVLNERFAFAGAFALVVLAALGVGHAVAQSDRAFGWPLAAATVAFAAGAVLVEHAKVIYENLPEWGVYAYFG